MHRILTTFMVMVFSASALAQDAAPPAAKETPAPPPAKPFVYTPKASDIVIGKSSAPLAIVEYASLSCPHCAHFFADVLPKISVKYIDSGKVKLVYRHFPLNEPALKAALLVNCAPPDRRHDFVSVLFKMQDKWAFSATSTDALKNIGALGGVPPEKFDVCMNNKEAQKEILSVEKEAADTFGVSSTPTFFMNGKEQKGVNNADAMIKAIDEALAAGKH